MKRQWILMLLVFVLVSILAPAAFAQSSAEPAGGSSNNYLWIAAGFSMAIAAFGGALGQGKIGAAACEGIARNPGAAKGIFTPMLLGLVFIETLSLLTLVIIFAKIK